MHSLTRSLTHTYTHTYTHTFKHKSFEQRTQARMSLLQFSPDKIRRTLLEIKNSSSPDDCNSSFSKKFLNYIPIYNKSYEFFFVN